MVSRPEGRSPPKKDDLLLLAELGAKLAAHVAQQYGLPPPDHVHVKASEHVYDTPPFGAVGADVIETDTPMGKVTEIRIYYQEDM